MFARLSLLVLVAVALLAAPIAPASNQDDASAAATPNAEPLTVLITGANRGIGLEFARQYHAGGHAVIGTARRPEAAEELRAIGVEVRPLDVTDAESVAALAAALKDRPIDVLINNAGVSGGGRSIENVDFDAVRRVLEVNTIGPMRVTQALLPNLRAGDRKLIVNISSGLGSIENNTRGGSYGYRESKAALNMLTRSLAAELRGDGFVCIAQSPGWVQTDMGGANARLTPEESISAMLGVFTGLTPEDTGRYFSHDGQPLPW